MKFPIVLPITALEAQILELSLRGDSELVDLLHGKRHWLIEIGDCLINKRDGQIKIESESEFWFLRDYITPNVTVGSNTGLMLIMKLYGLVIGYGMPCPKDENGNPIEIIQMQPKKKRAKKNPKLETKQEGKA